jgi:D-galacturonate reductase
VIKASPRFLELPFSFDSYPKDTETNPEACTLRLRPSTHAITLIAHLDKTAIDKLHPGDAVVIFTPDNTHYAIARYAIERRLHVLITKPATQLLSHHLDLIDLSIKYNVVCFVEHHKRYDPVYSDARARAKTLGEFNFFNAWMSQPKSQLETFRAWAGKDSDIR